MKETNQIIDRFLFSVMSAKLYESLIPMIVLIYVSHIYSSGGGILWIAFRMWFCIVLHFVQCNSISERTAWVRAWKIYVEWKLYVLQWHLKRKKNEFMSNHIFNVFSPPDNMCWIYVQIIHVSMHSIWNPAKI